MKINSKLGKALLAQIGPLKVGQKTQFDGPFSHLPTPVDAHLIEVEPGKFWQFSLFWNSIHIQDVVVELQGDKLVLDTLGA